MRNVFGTVLTLTLFGESHGRSIGAVIDGMSPGVRVDEEYIREKLDQRRPSGRISTQRREADSFEILSGVFRGYTTGSPICIKIDNQDTKSGDYDEMRSVARPSHADLTAYEKYGGFEDYRGGGHFSGRVTAALVAAGAIVMKALEDKGIRIGTHLFRCCSISDRQFADYEQDIEKLSGLTFPVLDEEAAKAMTEAIEKIASQGDSTGGILETAVTGLPAGAGEPWFDTVESVIAHGIFSVPAVKGIEFGAGFAMADMRGSQANDPIRVSEGKFYTISNNNGGINGGITNGMPVIFRTVVKPTSSIYKEQQTVDFKRKENTTLVIRGRHDPAIVHRARAVVDAVTAICLGDLLITRFGADYFRSQK